MNEFVCPSCGCCDYVNDIRYLSTSVEFKRKIIVSCSNCKLMSILPMPTDKELSRYYDKYWEKHNIQALNKLFELQAKDRYGFIEKHLMSSEELRVLDVGAGFGLIRKYFDKNIEYDAVEIDKDAYEYLKNSTGVNSVYQSLEGAVGYYDIIVLAHIVEHLNKPMEFMDIIKNKLSTNGIIFIEVPNKDYLYKTANEPHLLFFQPDTLESFVKRAGFNVVECNTCGKRLSEFKKSKNKYIILIKDFIKRIMPVSLVKIISNRNMLKYVNEMVIHYAYEYGDDRQWIRLIAKKIK